MVVAAVLVAEVVILRAHDAHTEAVLAVKLKEANDELARAMLTRPRLIPADEPTGNLDEANAYCVIDGLSAFAAESGAVLLVMHDMTLSSAQRTVHLLGDCLASPDPAA